MAGLMTFTTLEAALRAGFQVWDKTPTGYLVRKRGPGGLWMMALVELLK